MLLRRETVLTQIGNFTVLQQFFGFPFFSYFVKELIIVDW